MRSILPHIGFCINDLLTSAATLNPLSANPTKWSNCLSVFDHFVGLVLKGLRNLRFLGAERMI